MTLRHINNLSAKDIILLKKGAKCPLSIYRLFGYITNFYGGSLNLDKGIIDSNYMHDFKKNNKLQKSKQIEKIWNNVIEDIGVVNDVSIMTEYDEFNKTTKIYSIITKHL